MVLRLFRSVMMLVLSSSVVFFVFFVFFFKQKTAYEMRISDWSSDVCSSDLCPCQARWLHLVDLAANSRRCCAAAIGQGPLRFAKRPDAHYSYCLIAVGSGGQSLVSRVQLQGIHRLRQEESRRHQQIGRAHV